MYVHKGPHTHTVQRPNAARRRWLDAMSPLLTAACVACIVVLIAAALAHYALLTALRRARDVGLHAARVTLLAVDTLSFIPPFHVRSRSKIECIEIRRVQLRLAFPSLHFPSPFILLVDQPYVQLNLGITDHSLLFGNPPTTNPPTTGPTSPPPTEVPTTPAPNPTKDDVHPSLLRSTIRHVLVIVGTLLVRLVLTSLRIVIRDLRVSAASSTDASEVDLSCASIEFQAANEKFNLTHILSRITFTLHVKGINAEITHDALRGPNACHSPVISHPGLLTVSIAVPAGTRIKELEKWTIDADVDSITCDRNNISRVFELLLPKNSKPHTESSQSLQPQSIVRTTSSSNISSAQVPTILYNEPPLSPLSENSETSNNILNEDGQPLENSAEIAINRIRAKLLSFLQREISCRMSIKSFSQVKPAAGRLKGIMLQSKIERAVLHVKCTKKWRSSSYSMNVTLELSDSQLVLMSDTDKADTGLAHRIGISLSFFILLDEVPGSDKIVSKIILPSSASTIKEHDIWMYITLFSYKYLLKFVDELVQSSQPIDLFDKYVASGTSELIYPSDVCNYIVKNFMLDIDWKIEPLSAAVELNSGENIMVSLPDVQFIAKSQTSGLLSRHGTSKLESTLTVCGTCITLSTLSEGKMTIFNLPRLDIEMKFDAIGESNSISLRQEKFEGMIWNSKTIDNFLDCVLSDKVYTKATSALDVESFKAYYTEGVEKVRDLLSQESQRAYMEKASSNGPSTIRMSSRINREPVFNHVVIDMEGGELFVSGIDNKCAIGIVVGNISGGPQLNAKDSGNKSLYTGAFSIIPPLKIMVANLTLQTRRVVHELETVFASDTMRASTFFELQENSILFDNSFASVNVKNIGGTADLSNAWMLLKAFQFVYKQMTRISHTNSEVDRMKLTIAKATRAPERITGIASASKLSKLGKAFSLNVEGVNMLFKSTDAVADILMDSITLKDFAVNVKEGSMLVTAGSFSRERIFHLQNLSFNGALKCALFNLHIPFGFSFYNLLDSIIHYVKTFKAVLPHKNFPRFHLPPKWPKIEVHVSKLLLDADDYEIEVLLSFIAQHGKEEMLKRLERAAAFESMVVEMRDMHTKTLYEEARRAHSYLQKYNSASWIDICTNNRSKQHKLLTELVFWDVNLVLNTAKLSKPTCEESLHELDPDTPLGIIYMDMYPFDVRLETNGIRLQIRDYPIPIFEIPRRNKPVLISTGLLILAEEAPVESSKRHINVDVSYFHEICTITRSVYPMKFYCNLKHTISVDDTVRLCFGPAVEPGLQEFVNVIDQFTKPNVDPSPPIGWWDKLRLISHGRHVFYFTGGARFAIRMVGSMSPYFQPGLDYGSEGFEWIFGDNVTVDFGGPESSINIESGFMNGTLATGQGNDNFFKFVGGVTLLIGINFEVEGKRRAHSDIRLRTPKYCDGKGRWDSFANFRTSKILLDFGLYSKRALYSGLIEPLNFFRLSPEIMNHFGKMVSVLQSPLTNISREGDIWNRKSSGKPKLGRTIGGIRASLRLSPFVLTYQTYEFNGTAGVDLRFKAEFIAMDIGMERKAIIPATSGEDAKRSGQYATKSASVQLEEVEARAVTFGSADWNSEEYMGDPFCLTIQDVESEEEWFMQSDRLTEHSENWRMVPFFWTPQVTYFLRNQDSGLSATSGGELHDIFYSSQVSIYQARLRELDSLIAKTQSLINIVKAQMMKLDNKLVLSQEERLLKRLEVLKNRKTVVLRFIEQCKSSKADSIEDRNLSSDGTGKDVFRHNFVLHNGHMVWKRSVKNAIYKLFELNSRYAAISRMLSNSLTQVLKEYHQLLSKGDRTKEALSGIFGRANSTMDTYDDSFNSPIAVARSNRLLHQLIMERTSKFIVYREGYDENGEISTADHEKKQKKKEEAQRKRATHGLYYGQHYSPSSNEESPDYIAKNETFWSNFIFQCIHPQVNFEVEEPRDKRIIDSIIVGAEIMLLKHIRIYDTPSVATTAPDGQVVYDLGEKEPMKTRLILDVTNSQFHSARNTEVKVANSDFSTSKVINTGSGLWPVWIPMELLIGEIYPDPYGYLNLIVDKASATMHKETPNPLYYNAKRDNSQDHGSKYLISFHNFDVKATSAQYITIYNVITKMILRSNPSKVKEEERVQQLYFALEQLVFGTTKLENVFKRTFTLQHKMRYINRKLMANRSLVRMVSNGVQFNQQRDKAKMLAKAMNICQEEIAITIAAVELLKAAHDKGKVVDSAGSFRIFCDKLIWKMVLDKVNTLCLSVFEKIDFVHKSSTDKSASNTLTIDKLRIENLMPTCPFTELIGPYIPNKAVYNLYQRQNMLRIYWRELPAVAGIAVIDHFEVNFFPLLLHLTYDTVKSLVAYVFPDNEEAELPVVNEEDLIALYSAGHDLYGQPKRLRLLEAKAEGTNGGGTENGSTTAVGKKNASKKDVKNRGAHVGTTGTAGAESNSSSARQYEDLKRMQVRASENKSYIYIKIPAVEHCLNYRGPKDKNIEDITMFVFKMQTLEFRNKTWTMLDMLNAIKKEVMKSVLANTGALVREKLFAKRKTGRVDLEFLGGADRTS